jgi:hypothetical protein
MKRILLYFVIPLSIISCLGQNSKTEKVSIESESIKTNDSIKEVKYQFKEKINNLYLRLPFAFGLKDDIDYSQYEEFKEFDSIVNQYTKYPLSDNEKQLLTITSAKKNLILSKYSEVIQILNELPENSDLNNYKNILLAICYDLKGDSFNSSKIFKNLLNELEQDKNTECVKYFLVKTLAADASELNLCKDYLNLYNEIKSVDRNEIIKTYFLMNSEL